MKAARNCFRHSFIEKDGKFTSTEVVLEARDYDSALETVGDRQPLATWSYISAQVMMMVQCHTKLT
ncbi:hypothetical protein D0856_07825 [Vibrio owensii]|uniref:hypothetical protein n=1 Tax=Vibrio owensii TaxID=696485 RepID=UPI000EFD8187|nr:hypothetical protein [Vibrio owensii]AYO20009.1 hypothetical protein D0856_07825 [Vibrio owensii]